MPGSWPWSSPGHRLSYSESSSIQRKTFINAQLSISLRILPKTWGITHFIVSELKLKLKKHLCRIHSNYRWTNPNPVGWCLPHSFQLCSVFWSSYCYSDQLYSVNWIFWESKWSLMCFVLRQSDHKILSFQNLFLPEESKWNESCYVYGALSSRGGESESEKKEEFDEGFEDVHYSLFIIHHILDTLYLYGNMVRGKN